MKKSGNPVPEVGWGTQSLPRKVVLLCLFETTRLHPQQIRFQDVKKHNLNLSRYDMILVDK
jgi:hypothetical protein